MTSRTTLTFRKRYLALPENLREQARRTYVLWRESPYHSSLHFKRVNQRQPVYSVRIGINYRALGLVEGNTIYWFWIGPHAEYDELLKRL